jgi:mannose-6-phosphate isomerase
MAIEHAAVRIARKPWGVGDLQPWSSIDVAGDGMRGLMAYPGLDPVAALLQDAGELTKSAGMSADNALKSSETVEVQA